MDLRERARELAAIHLREQFKCDGTDSPMHAALTAVLLQFAREALTEQAAEINSWIKPGDLGGNGCDKTAQRNGLILAYNATVVRAAALAPSPSGRGGV